MGHPLLLYPYYPLTTRRSAPLILDGFSNPSMPRRVGEISRREPSSRRRYLDASSLTRITGTGLVVWEVCGPPDTGSTIISAFPWSAVINIDPPRSFSAW